MIKDQEYLSEKASYCLDLAKKLGATDSSVIVGNSISETVNFRNQKLDESNRSDNLAINLTTYIGKKKSSISSSNLLKENLDTLIEKCVETTKNTPEDEFNSLPDKDLLAKEVKDLDLFDETNIKNEKSGPFENTMVVSMRIFKKDQVDKIINICKSFHWAHGKPIHVGDPNEIGINNIFKPTWGDKPRSLLKDEVNMFWACGVTPQNAILNSSVEFCISHTPGYMLITDIKEDAETPILQ